MSILTTNKAPCESIAPCKLAQEVIRGFHQAVLHFLKCCKLAFVFGF